VKGLQPRLCALFLFFFLFFFFLFFFLFFYAPPDTRKKAGSFDMRVPTPSRLQPPQGRNSRAKLTGKSLKAATKRSAWRQVSSHCKTHPHTNNIMHARLTNQHGSHWQR
jgi:hypothetical protein